LNGSAMMVGGRSISTALGVALVSGVLASLATYVAGIWITKSRKSAAIGAALAIVLPWSARLGVSTVPELPTAALTLLGAAAVSAPPGDPRRARRLWLGGLSLFAATLSRYEPWFVAAGFVGLVGLDLARARSPRDRPAEIGAATLALLGPALWMLWNRHAHGSALHFLDRVSAYRDAIDHGSVSSRVGGYLFALARAEPEALALGIALLVHVRRAEGSALKRILAPFGRAIGLSGFLLVTLTLSSIRGGAPTHHPERALFFLFLLGALVAGHAIAEAATSPSLRPPRALVLTIVLLVAASSFPVRRWVLQSESYAAREREIDAGRTFASRVPAGEPTLLEVVDYGYFAVQAASGRPEDLSPDHRIDPRAPLESPSLGALVDLARERRYAHLLVRRRPEIPAGTRVRAGDDAFMILDLEPSR
jgi:hypothetical protein